MSANVGYSTLDLIPNVAGFAPALTGGITAEVSKPLAAAGLGGGRLLGAGLARMLGPLAVASAAAWAVGKTAAFIGGAVSSAADLEQSEGAVATVFKGSSAELLAASKDAASSVGLARNEYATLATLLGTQLRNGGTAADALSGQTEQLIGLGADLSALFGGSTQTAVEALSSALKGERDPIERYGVSLTQAAVDAKAAELGFKKVGGALSTQASQAATLALILDQTSDAHGAFGRETDTLANKQQRLNAMWQNATAAIGSAFLPAASGLAGGLIGVLGPALGGVVGLARGLLGVGSAIVDTFGGVAAAFAPALPRLTDAARQLLPALAAVLPSLSPVAILLHGLLPVLPQLLPMIVELATLLGGALVDVHAQFVPLVGALGALFHQQLAAILPFLVQAVCIAVGLFAVTGPAFLSFVSAVLPLVSSLVADVLPRLVELVAALVPVLSDVATLIAAVGPVVGVLLGVLLPMVEGLAPVLQAATALVIAVVTAALQVVQGVLQVATGVLSGNWGQVWSGLGTILSGVWALLTGVLRGALDLVVAAIRAGASNVGRLFGAAWDGATALLGSMTDGLRSSVEGGTGTVLDFLGGLGSTVRGAISGAGSWLADVGRFMVEGFVDGVKAMTQRIADALLAPIRDSVEGVKAFLGIHSPSRVMREHGADSVEDGLRESWVSPSEIDRLAPRSFVESIEDGLRQRGEGEELSFELPSTGSVKGDLEAVDFLLRSRRALEPA